MTPLRRWWNGWPQTPALGGQGESAAARYLESRGYQILMTNFRLQGKSAGEIDLIARDDQTIVFIEVKTRRSDEILRPEAQVNRRKQHQISRLARTYLTRYQGPWPKYRFDIVAIVWKEGSDPEIEHQIAAFQAE